jgi:multidrug resistance efflux pump
VSVHLDRMDRAAHQYVADVKMDAYNWTESVMQGDVLARFGETNARLTVDTAKKDADMRTESVIPGDV